jgi:hypothetical protein
LSFPGTYETVNSWNSSFPWRLIWHVLRRPFFQFWKFLHLVGSQWDLIRRTRIRGACGSSLDEIQKPRHNPVMDIGSIRGDRFGHDG